MSRAASITKLDFDRDYVLDERTGVAVKRQRSTSEVMPTEENKGLRSRSPVASGSELGTTILNSGSPPFPPAPIPKSPYRSHLEAEYAGRLEVLKRAGDILEWWHEGITLRLADGVRFTPDFLVFAVDLPTADWPLELHEVKGFMRDDARIKLKVAAKLFPCFRFKLCRKVQGRWEMTNV